MTAERIVILAAAAGDGELARLVNSLEELTDEAVEAEGYHNRGRLLGRWDELVAEGARVPVVIVDEKLRDGSGVDALVELAQRSGPRPGTVLISAGGPPEDLPVALEADALDAILTREWRPSELSLTLDRLATEFLLEHHPDTLERVPQLIDVALLSHAYKVAEGRERRARDQLRTARRSFFVDRGLSDEEVEEAMIAELDRVLDHPEREVYPEGTMLLRAGQVVDTIYIVLEGRMRLYWEVEGEEVVFYSRTAGRILGLLAMARTQPATFNCRVVEEVTAIPVPLERLDDALQRSPTLAVDFVTVLLRSLARRALRSVEMQLQIDLLARNLATERDQLAATLRQLEQAQTRLIESEKMATLGQLVAGIGHELNNPVAAITRAAEFVAEDIAAMTVGRPDSPLLTGAFDDARSGPPSSTKTERSQRAALAAALGDDVLARRLVDVGITEIAAYRRLVEPLDSDQRDATLEEMEAYHRLGTALRNIRSSAERIGGLVKSLRSYARAGKEPFADVDVEEGLEETLLLLGHALHDVTLERNYGSVPTVAGYGGELNQVWTNLLTNALQAMEGAGRLEVATDTPEPGWVRVRVIDSGPGIAPEDLGRIFDLAFTTKAGRVEFGLGLGLRIAQDIVTRHRGRIEVESRPGRTCFSVWLPTEPGSES